MGTPTSYANALMRIKSSGGSVRVTCSTNVGQGNDGTSLKCHGCWVQPVIGNTDVVKMNIDIAASATLGVDLARSHINEAADSYGVATAQPMWVPIDNVNKLYFYSVDADAVIDILYLE